MKRIIINGKFMGDRMQGIVRYAREIVSALDNILGDDLSVELVIPKNAKEIPDFKRIRIIQIGKNTGIKWEQTDFRRYVNLNKDAICLNLCNVAPFGCNPGITTVHDIMYKVFPGNYTTLRNKISRLWHLIQYEYIFRHEKLILTVSEFSKNEIEKYYPYTKGKIEVVPNGWQHVLKYKENPHWQEDYLFLKPHQYYFSLSTLAKNKNGKWIMQAAKHNPKEVFAIAGKKYDSNNIEIPPNVHMLGFISDEDACSLIKNCKAFIHPALYEGFGIPPLEALALGADVIASNTSSLPEVLGKSVHYIDPHDANVNLEKLLERSIGDKHDSLKRYSWQDSAKKLKKVLLDLE